MILTITMIVMFAMPIHIMISMLRISYHAYCAHDDADNMFFFFFKTEVR